jgi:glutamate-1-semialdehyde 2,1-aminomutase
VKDWDGAAACDTKAFAAYFRKLLANGIYMPAAQFESFFLSAAHTDADIERTAEEMINAIDSV